MAKVISIRPAIPGDAALVLGMVRELAEHERALHEVETTEAMMEEALFGSSPAVEALVGEIDGKPQGVALYFQNYSSWTGRRGMYLEDLYVRPEARGAGLGAALLRRVAAIAVTRGCVRFEWVVLDWNDVAIEFYKRLGAQAMTEWTIHRISGEALKALAGEP